MFNQRHPDGNPIISPNKSEKKIPKLVYTVFKFSVLVERIQNFLNNQHHSESTSRSNIHPNITFHCIVKTIFVYKTEIIRLKQSSA